MNIAESPVSTEQTAQIDAELFNAVTRHFVNVGDKLNAQFIDGKLKLWSLIFDTVSDRDEPVKKGYLEGEIPASDWETTIDDSDVFAIDNWNGLYKSLTKTDSDTVTVSIEDNTLLINDREISICETHNERLSLSLKELNSSVQILHGNTVREWVQDDSNSEYARVALSEKVNEWDKFRVSFRNAGSDCDEKRMVMEHKNDLLTPEDLKELGDVSFSGIGSEVTNEETPDNGRTRANIVCVKRSFLEDFFDKTLKRHTTPATYTFMIEAKFPLIIERSFSDMFSDSESFIKASLTPTFRENIDGEFDNL